MTENFEGTRGAGRRNGRSKSASRWRSRVFALVVIAGSVQVGIGWGAEGPKAGFFPFYVGLVILGSSVINFGAVLLGAIRQAQLFAEWGQLAQGDVDAGPDSDLCRADAVDRDLRRLGDADRRLHAMARPLRLEHGRRDRGGRAGRDLSSYSKSGSSCLCRRGRSRSCSGSRQSRADRLQACKHAVGRRSEIRIRWKKSPICFTASPSSSSRSTSW